MASKKAICPHCGERQGVPIIYGLPGPGLVGAAMRGEVRIGGCCISPDNPTHARKSCDHEWIAEGARTSDM